MASLPQALQFPADDAGTIVWAGIHPKGRGAFARDHAILADSLAIFPGETTVKLSERERESQGISMRSLSAAPTDLKPTYFTEYTARLR